MAVALAAFERAAAQNGEAQPGRALEAFPEAATTASNGVVRASISSAPNELIASTIRPMP